MILQKSYRLASCSAVKNFAPHFGHFSAYQCNFFPQEEHVQRFSWSFNQSSKLASPNWSRFLSPRVRCGLVLLKSTSILQGKISHWKQFSIFLLSMHFLNLHSEHHLLTRPERQPLQTISSLGIPASISHSTKARSLSL
jgi:hypothetical protein